MEYLDIIIVYGPKELIAAPVVVATWLITLCHCRDRDIGGNDAAVVHRYN